MPSVSGMGMTRLRDGLTKSIDSTRNVPLGDQPSHGHAGTGNPVRRRLERTGRRPLPRFVPVRRGARSDVPLRRRTIADQLPTTAAGANPWGRAPCVSIPRWPVMEAIHDMLRGHLGVSDREAFSAAELDEGARVTSHIVADEYRVATLRAD